MRAIRNRTKIVLAACSSLCVAAGLCGEWNTDLQRYGFEQLTLLGTFKQGKDELACFQLPDRSMKAVGVHDYIGPNHAVISSVTMGYVEISYLVLVNQDEWAMSKFRWPVKKGANPNLSKCGNR